MARRRHVVQQNKTYSQRIPASARAAQAIKVQAQRGRDPPPLQTPRADTRNCLTHAPPFAPFEAGGHDGVRRHLASEEESTAAERALLLIAGRRQVNFAFPRR
jgi:hypothetical protein